MLAWSSFVAMLAIVLDDHGGPEVLQLREVPDPVPGPDEIVVSVASTAVNRADVLQRLGFYPQPAPVPEFEIPGLEFAGRVHAIGSHVTAWSVGDAVMGIVSGGGYATQVVVHERQAMAVPAAVPLADAAAIPEVWVTAFDALVAQCAMRAGDAVLIHAGASGVGTAGTQLAKAMGALVIVTTSAGKVDRCQELGADFVVDYDQDDFVEAVASFTKGRGVDVVLDVVGGDYLNRNLQALAPLGRLVQVGTMQTPRTDINLGLLMTKRLTMMGTVLRARPIEEKVAISRRFAHEVLGGFESGIYQPVIDRRFALADVAAAHSLVESNSTFGKVVLNP